MMDINNTVMFLQTIQVAPMRHLFAGLKEMVVDLNIIADGKRLKMTNFDKTHTCLVVVEMTFDKHYCEPDKISLCANSHQLFKLISNLTSNDILTMYIDKRDYCDGIVAEMCIQFDNTKIGVSTNYKLKMFDPDDEELETPDVNYSTVIVMPSAGLQAIIRSFHGLTGRIKIESVGNDVFFSGVGEWCKTRVCCNEQPSPQFEDINTSVKFEKKPDQSVVMQGEFPIKSLLNIARYTNCSPHCYIYLENDLPLVVKYAIGSEMGNIKICVAPLPSGNDKN